MNATRPTAVCLMGPTASGKTDLAMALVDTGPFEIVSVDSALVYRGMDIGTAKPTAGILRQYPHQLVDIRDPADAYSAADFRADALVAMDDIRARGRIPLLTGGTMLYFKALKEGIAVLPPADPETRERISRMAEASGWPAVHEKLASIDPVSASRINPNDPQRLQRALEIYELSGKTMTELHEDQADRADPCPYELIEIILFPEDRALLHARIEARFRQMLANGFVAEVEALRARGDLDPGMPSIKAVGYRQVWAHLDGEYPYDDMVSKGIAATRQLAKRQLTWLRGWSGGARIPAPDLTAALKILTSGSILG